MYCILVTGIPASEKSTLADFLAERLKLPVISKDRLKELMYDTIGFRSREEKVRLGTAAMEIMYDMAERLMKCGLPFILENNFENASKEGLMTLLGKYACPALTITLTGDYERIWQRFVERNHSPERHRGHVVNDCYPETEPGGKVPVLSYEDFVNGIVARGMDRFTAGGPHIVLDATEPGRIDREELLKNLEDWRRKLTGD